MKTINISEQLPAISALALGMMRIRDKNPQEINALVKAAEEAGINLFDHADIYGGTPHICEQKFADALKLSPGQREKMILQTKTGIDLTGPLYNFSYEHIVESVDSSLRALETDYIDILLLHRPDTLVEPEEVAKAFDALEKSGKVRVFGVSNHTPSQIELLKTAVQQPLKINQLQISLPYAPIIARGMGAVHSSGAQDSIYANESVLDYSRINGITLQAWSPFQAVTSPGTFLGSADFAELNQVIERIAAEHGVSPIAVATAWITSHPAHLQVTIGSTSAERIEQAALGTDLKLNRAEWYELLRAAGYTLP